MSADGILVVLLIFGAASAPTAAVHFECHSNQGQSRISEEPNLLDEEVNTSTITRLGRWRNINQALDPRA